MKPRNAEAERLEKDYWNRLEAAIAPLEREDAEEIRQGVKDHIEEALSAQEGPEASLVQMAEVLERLGAPETFAKDASEREQETTPQDKTNKASPSPGSCAQTQQELEADKPEWYKFIDKLWLAVLIGVAGLYIPVINIYVCSIISVAMIAFALKADIISKSRELQDCKGLITTVLILLCIMPITSLLGLVHPLFAIIELPVAIAVVVVDFIVFWKIMTGLGELMSTYSRNDIAEKIYSARLKYILLTLSMIVVLGTIAAVITLSAGSHKGEEGRIVADLIVGAISLPIGWIIGGLFYLRPISDAKQALK